MRHRKRHLFISFIIAASVHALAGLTAGTIVYMRYSQYEPVYEITFSNIDITDAPVEEEVKPVVKPPEPAPRPPVPEPVKRVEKAIPKAEVAEPLPVPAPAIQEAVSQPVTPVETTEITEKPAIHPEPYVANDKSRIDPLEIGKSIIRPKYPVGARHRGEEGSVTISIKVSSAGKAESITVVESSGYKTLDESAVSAAKKAQYVNPSSGEFMQGEATVTIRFKLLEL